MKDNTIDKFASVYRTFCQTPLVNMPNGCREIWQNAVAILSCSRTNILVDVVKIIIERSIWFEGAQVLCP